MRPNEMRISCRPSCRRPHKPTFHSALEEGAAHAEFGASSACRLHARVRRRPGAIIDSPPRRQVPCSVSSKAGDHAGSRQCGPVQALRLDAVMADCRRARSH
jgi:hypothetical protein